MAAAVLRFRGRRNVPVDDTTEERLEQIQDTASWLHTRVAQLEARQRIRASLVRNASAQYTATVLDESLHTLPNHYGGFSPLSDTEQLEQTSLEATPVVIQEPVPVVRAAALELVVEAARSPPFSLLNPHDGFGVTDSDTRADILAYFMLQEREGCGFITGPRESYDPSTIAVVDGGTLNRIAIRMMHCSIVGERHRNLQNPEMRRGIADDVDARLSEVTTRLGALIQELHNLTGSTSLTLGMAATGLSAGSPQDHRS